MISNLAAGSEPAPSTVDLRGTDQRGHRVGGIEAVAQVGDVVDPDRVAVAELAEVGVIVAADDVFMISGAKPSIVACMMRWSAYCPKSSETTERQPVLTRCAGLYQRTILGSALRSISPEPSAMPNSPTHTFLSKRAPRPAPHLERV